MLLFEVVVEEIQSLIPGASYVKSGEFVGKFRLPHNQYVTVNKSGRMTVSVWAKLLVFRDCPEDGYFYDDREFCTLEGRLEVAQALRAVLGPCLEDSTPSSPRE